MSTRGPRTGRCPGGGPRTGTSRPTLTRTEMVRQAKTAAVVQKEPHESSKSGRGGCPAGRRTSLAKLGPPPLDPKKIDFKRPGVTKAMQMRQKVAMEKLQRDAEAQRKMEEMKRRPRRAGPPVGGDARIGYERVTSTRRDIGDNMTRLQDAISQGRIATRRGCDKSTRDLDEAVSRGHIVTDRRGVKSKKPREGVHGISRRGPLATATPIPGGTQELARSMNAQVVQAVPLSDGPVDKIIIEPGVISEDRSTIVCITRPGGLDGSGVAGTSNIANRSIRVINESLDEQDAVENAAVQGKLEELQNARREFVIAVANVGGNAVSIPEENDLSILDVDDMPDALHYIPTPPKPSRRIVNLPDVSHEMFQVEYGLNHPDVMAARAFTRRSQAAFEQREAERRIEEGFAARAAAQEFNDLRFDVPFEQDIMDGDISFEEDDEGNMIPCASRIKASMPPIPMRKDTCSQAPITVEELQRFMDLERYPPTPKTPGPPPGRENLHPDLWQIEDPWYFEERQSDGPDLMRFDVSC